MGTLNEHIVKSTGWVHGSAHLLEVAFAFPPLAGTLTTGSGKFRLPIDSSYAILGSIVTVNTAPTGLPVIVDILKNGTTIYTTTANRPTIAVSAFMSATAYTTPDVVAVAPGDYLQWSVSQIGSGTAGADLFVRVLAKRAA